mmetsp:Transcript_33467/g.30458  ORF Transcript_33467/g.30458 Transcript_33467/m.30458 type:complete len:133 (-) Transcript_33467:25-423(-)
MVLFLLHKIYCVFIKKPYSFWDNSVFTFLLIFYTYQPQFIIYTTQLYSCTKLNTNTNYLVSNLNIQCDSEEDSFWKQWVGLPVLIICVIVFPLVLQLKVYYSLRNKPEINRKEELHLLHQSQTKSLEALKYE